jgi:DNA-binding MarR family transcriptional regulator
MARSSGPPAKRDEDALYDVIRYVRPLHRYMAKAVEEQLQGTGVTPGLRAVLEQLFEQGPRTVPQVSRGMELGRQFILRLMNQGLQQGLLEDRPNPAHRRSPLFALTPRGQALIERIKAREAANLRALAADMDRKDIDACLRVLSRMADRFRPEPGSLEQDTEDPESRG